MQPPVETIRLSARAAEQLQQLKRRTGIPNWNTLARIAFCLSLAQPDEPTTAKIPSDSSVEMTWKVFGGHHDAMYSALLRTRAQQARFPGGAEDLASYFRAHLHRGIAMLYPVRTLQQLAVLVVAPSAGGRQSTSPGPLRDKSEEQQARDATDVA